MIHYAFVVSILMISTGCIHSNKESATIIPLSGQWEIIPRANMTAIPADSDNEKYENITIPGSWLHILKKNKDLSSLIWLRKEFYLDSACRDKTLLLYIGEIGIADETYLNGVMIGSTGRIPEKKGAWNISRHGASPGFIPCRPIF